MKGNIRYFELPDIKAATDINNWSLIGSDQEDAVVCSNDVTYSIKKVEMSSDAYILPPSSDSKFEVSGSANSYYEVLFWLCACVCVHYLEEFVYFQLYISSYVVASDNR